MKRRLFLLYIFGTLLFLPWPVRAQEATSGAQTDAAVLQKQSLEAEIQQLEVIYRGQLTEYRSAEKEFQIARDQYLQLQTIASIEAVSVRAQKVLRIRDQVMLTYLELLRTHLIAADGVEVSLKQTVLTRLEEQKIWLQSHQTTVTNTTDREQLNALSDEFIGRQESLENVSYETNSLLAMGKLQNVLDRLDGITADLKTQEASNSALLHNRSLLEIDRLSTLITADLNTQWGELSEDITQRDVRSFYEGMPRTLDPIYANLHKLVSFLAEVLRTL